MIELFDTHCHIHFGDYALDPDEAVAAAKAAEVTRLLLVGCTLEDSQGAVDFVQTRDQCWASIGLHPHEASKYIGNTDALRQFEMLAKDHARVTHVDGVQGGNEKRANGTKGTESEYRKQSTQQSATSTSRVIGSAGKQAGAMRKLVAIGECGLDYYYNHSPKEKQRQLFEFQLHLAQKYDLPVIFHVREAFDDFFAILEHFEGIRGVVHSFTSNQAVLDKILQKGLYIGLNGIMTFTTDQAQLAAAKVVPIEKLLLETDAPFLTPRPFRGTICQPKHVRNVAEFLSELRNESLETLSQATTQNAKRLFNVN